MKRFGVIIGFVVLCVACSSSTPPAESEPTSQGPKLTRTEARALVEEMLQGSDLSTRTPSLRHDLPCLEMTDVVTINEAGQAVLNPQTIGLFKSVVQDDDGFHLEFFKPLKWEVTIENLWELSPGLVDVSYTASVLDPPVYLALWFEACASESGTEKMMLTDQDTRHAELSDDGEWRFQSQPG